MCLTINHSLDIMSLLVRNQSDLRHPVLNLDILCLTGMNQSQLFDRYHNPDFSIWFSFVLICCIYWFLFFHQYMYPRVAIVYVKQFTLQLATPAPIHYLYFIMSCVVVIAILLYEGINIILYSSEI